MKRQIKRCLWIGIILLVVVPLLLLLSCQLIITLATSQISKSENPPATLQESDLVGTWEADYGGCYAGVDRLILRTSGTFKQIYRNECEDYIYETPWNKWWLERFPDGRVRLHLKGARYFRSGIYWAEKDEGWNLCDPFARRKDWRDWSVRVVRKLVLNVRVLPSGELVLAHMWSNCADDAFGDSQVFHRIGSPSPLETPAP